MRAVVFDAVGTLIHPQPKVSQIYADIGRRHGSKLDDATVARRFKAAFQRQDEIDRNNRWATSEERERSRWREIVADVFDDVPFESCFDELYAHFARPQAWHVDAGAAKLIASLSGCVVAMASNFDERLHGIVAGLPELSGVQHVIVSSEVGWRKPGREFFRAVESRLGVAAKEIAFVGDDPLNDGEGAAQAGMRSVLLGRDVRHLAEIVGHASLLK
ncbi:MAG: HAD-IA family hydrolase [Planctomycetota bacterium]